MLNIDEMLRQVADIVTKVTGTDLCTSGYYSASKRDSQRRRTGLGARPPRPRVSHCRRHLRGVLRCLRVPADIPSCGAAGRLPEATAAGEGTTTDSQAHCTAGGSGAGNGGAEWGAIRGNPGRYLAISDSCATGAKAVGGHAVHQGAQQTGYVGTAPSRGACRCT